MTANVQTTGTSSQIVLTVQAAPGSDQFTLTLYDAVNGTGNILSTGSITSTVAVASANAVTVVNGGVVKTFTMSVASAINPGTALTQAFSYTAFDADGNAIMGAFDAPVALANADTSGTFVLSASTVPNSSTPITIAYNGSSTVTQTTITATTQSAASTSNGSATLGSLTIAPPKPAPSSSAVLTGGSGSVCLQSSYAFTSAELASLRVTVNGAPVTQSLGLSGCVASFTAPAGTNIPITLTLPVAGTAPTATLTAATTRAFADTVANVVVGGTAQIPITISCVVASFMPVVASGTFLYPNTSATIAYTISALDGSGAAACTSGTYVNATFASGTFVTAISGAAGLAVTGQAAPGTPGSFTDNGSAASSAKLATSFAGTTATTSIPYTTLAVGWAYERVGGGRTGSTPPVQGTNVSFAVPGADTPAWNTMVSGLASGPIFDPSGNIWVQTGSGLTILSGIGTVAATNASFTDTLLAFDHGGKLYTTPAGTGPTTVNIYAVSGFTTSLLRTIAAPGTVCSADADTAGNVYVGLCSTGTQVATIIEYGPTGSTVAASASGYTSVVLDGSNDVFAFAPTTAQGSTSIVRWSSGTPITLAPTPLLTASYAASPAVSFQSFAVDARGDVCALTTDPTLSFTFTPYDASGLGLPVCPATMDYASTFGASVSDARPAGQLR